MELTAGDPELEALNKELNDDAALLAYKAPYDNYKVSLLPKVLGTLLVFSGNLFYGRRPSYLKFRAVEVIARVPYQSWESAVFTLITLFYTNEHKALKLARVSKFARLAQDNETMHVIVISQLARREQRAGVIRHTLIPMIFALFYFWASYLLYLLNKRWSLELNYMFESHAFEQYSLFLEQNEESLMHKSVDSEFLLAYGRDFRCQYDFFRSVRNDEIVHRNTSIREIAFEKDI